MTNEYNALFLHLSVGIPCGYETPICSIRVIFPPCTVPAANSLGAWQSFKFTDILVFTPLQLYAEGLVCDKTTLKGVKGKV